MAARAGIAPGWLNDGAKGFLSEQGEFSPFLELQHLRVMLANPEYLLAMTGTGAAAGRPPQLSAVVGSMICGISVIFATGMPLSSECFRMEPSLSARYTQNVLSPAT